MDYSGLGLKAGLEVHQQLNSGKLFCRCPSELRDDTAHGTIKRYIRPNASDMGEFDKAALEQFKRGYYYVYEYYNDTTCEIEMDEAPPKKAEREALRTCIEIALMTKSNILKKAFVMRKLVIDGSNTSGFQRTALIATGGKIKLSNKEIGIQTIVLEEDSAKLVRKEKDHLVYRVDRLGVPLIEIATEPELFSPQEVKEAALEIGNLLRSTGKTKRGLGTIRQDVNVSIKGGTRIEIKGVQDLQAIDEYVKREAQRQQKLLEIMQELQQKQVKETDLEQKPQNLMQVFSQTQCKFIKNAKDTVVLGVRLKKFSGLIGKELQPQRRFGTELSDYVKTKTSLNGILHSDELPAYGISEKEVQDAKKELSCSQEDAFVLVIGPQKTAMQAIQVVIERCQTAIKEIPPETRNALEGGNTEYNRPLPGAARLYPETDLNHIQISQEEIDWIKKDLPLTEQERLELYTKKFGLNQKLAQEMKLNNFARFFEKMIKKGFDPTKTAVTLLEQLQQAKRMGANTTVFSNEMLEEFIEQSDKGKIQKEVQVELLCDWAKNPDKTLGSLLEEKNMQGAKETEIEQIIMEIINKNRQFIKEKGKHATSALMGQAMAQLKGKASGELVSKILLKEIEKIL